MIDKIQELITEAEVFTAQTKEEVEAFRIKYLGKKGLLNDFFAEFKNVGKFFFHTFLTANIYFLHGL